MPAPKGNTNAAKASRLSKALQKRLEERAQESELMDVLLTKALDGDMQAIREVFDRIDGKAAQSVSIDAEVTTTEKKLTQKEIALLAKELNEDC